MCHLLFTIDLYTFGSLTYDFDKESYYNDSDKEWFQANLASGIEQSVSGLPLLFYGEVELETVMHFKASSNGPSWDPNHQNYYLRVSTWYSCLNIQYEQLCLHNIDEVDLKRNGWYNRVSIGFDYRRCGSK